MIWRKKLLVLGDSGVLLAGMGLLMQVILGCSLGNMGV